MKANLGSLHRYCLAKRQQIEEHELTLESIVFLRYSGTHITFSTPKTEPPLNEILKAMTDGYRPFFAYIKGEKSNKVTLGVEISKRPVVITIQHETNPEGNLGF
jgi:hypothetical protein